MNRRAFLRALIAATAVLPIASRLGPSRPRIDDFAGLNYIDLPIETGNITALVPTNGYVLAFTERAIYRIDHVSGPMRWDGRRFRASRIDNDFACVTKQRYL